MDKIVEKIKNLKNAFSLWTDKHLGVVKKYFLKFYNYKDVSFVLFLYLVAILMVGYTLINNSLTIPLSGDFVLQEIPFYYNGYDDWWTALKTGSFPLWDESGMLGVNNIGANSFYYLFNIFFLPTLLFPRSLVPQVQAFLMITKLVLAGLFMKKLLDIFKVKKETSKMVATAYAFSGWAFFYFWFNHFLEIAVLMPVMLIGIEKIIQDRKPTYLILALFITALTNFFFFISFCFCGVIYALFRFFQYLPTYTKREKLEVMGQGVASFAIAIIMSSIILVPAFISVQTNSRVQSATYLSNLQNVLKALLSSFKSFKLTDILKSFKDVFNALFVWNKDVRIKNLLYPLTTFFYPTISCYSHLLWVNTGYDNTLSSLYIYCPLLLFFIPSIIKSIKEKKISHLVALGGILILLFTPFAYYCFSGFTSVAYGRWEIFIVAVLCIYEAKTMDDLDKIEPWSLDLSMVITVIIQIALLSYCLKVGGTLNTSPMPEDNKSGAIAMIIWTVVCYVIIRVQLKKKDIQETIRYMIGIEAVVLCSFLLEYHGTHSYSTLYGGPSSVKEETSIVNKLKKEDDSFYRIFSKTADRDGNNLGMVEGYNGIGTFHSVYNYNLNSFLSWSHVTYGSSGWSMGVHEKRANLDEFLGIKYYILPSNDTNVPFGYTKIMETNGKTVYRNDNHIELGFSFDRIYQTTVMDSSYRSYNGATEKNEILYLTGATFKEEDYNYLKEKYPSFDYYYYASDALGPSLSGLTIPKINASNVRVYQAVWNEKQDGFNGFRQKDGSVYDVYDENKENHYGDDYLYYSEDNTKGLLWNSYLEVRPTSLSPIAPEASSRGGAFVSVRARMGENLNIILYGEDDKILTQDRHMIHWYDKTYDYKYERGFYVQEEVKKIEIRVYDTLKPSNYLVLPTVTYEYYDTYQARINELKKYAFENIKKTSDKMSFDTSYDKERMIVLQVPYDEGWHLKITDENGKEYDNTMYCATGGFISFVAPSGKIHYSLYYYTPGLSLGMKGLSIGIALFSSLYIALELIGYDKKFIKESLKLN